MRIPIKVMPIADLKWGSGPPSLGSYIFVDVII